MNKIFAKFGTKSLITGTALAALLITVNDLTAVRQITASAAILTSRTDLNPVASDKVHSISNIVAVNLFGIVSTSLPPVEIIDNLPETTLKLVLRGVVVSTTSTQSNAMIEGNNGAVHNYVVGSEIEAGTTLSAIHNDRIILERRDRLETLFFPQPQKQASQPFSRLAKANTQSAARVVTAGDQPQPSQMAEPIRVTQPQRATSQQQPSSSNQASLLDRLNQLRDNNQSL